MTFDYRAWRARLGLNDLQAAKLLGISPRHSYYLSRGDYKPRPTTITACQHFEAQRAGDCAD